MSKDKYPSIFSRQIEAVVYLFHNTRGFENWEISLEYFQSRDAFRPIARERKYLLDYKFYYHSSYRPNSSTFSD